MKKIYSLSNRFQVVKFKNGFYGLIDNKIVGFQVVMSGFKSWVVLEKEAKIIYKDHF